MVARNRFLRLLLTLAALSGALYFALIIAADVPFLLFAIAGAFLLHLGIRPARRELLATAAAAAVLLAGNHYLARVHPRLSITVAAAMLGLGSMAVLAVRAIWADRAQRARCLDALGPALVLTFFVIGSRSFLNLPGMLRPRSLDLYLFAFDASLGFHPSFLVGQWCGRSEWIARLISFSYAALPLPIAVVYAGHVYRRRLPRWYMMEAFMAAGLIGYALYSVFPAAGPMFVFRGFPRAPFPAAAVRRLALEAIPLGFQVPRNAMPSLHMTWALLVCWASRPLARSIRAFALLCAALTFLSTMAVGEHYLADLIVAFPFTLFIEALCFNWTPLRSRERARPLLAGAALVAAWLLALRYAAPAWRLSPLLPWTAMAATFALCGWLNARLWRTLMSTSAPAASAGASSNAIACETPVTAAP